jgi:Cu-Zn family superoxide dismutase
MEDSMKSKICLIDLSVLLFAGAVVASAQQPGSIKDAIAVISPASGSNCRGIVRFTEEGSGVRVTSDIEGLAPGTKHGFHIHEYGDCSAADASSAGGHYDPAGTKHHGRPSDTVRHGGDMGNLEADAAGKVHHQLLPEGVTLGSGAASLLGRGVIIHANPDDFSQPVGNAGGRIGCGVIGIAKPGK